VRVDGGHEEPRQRLPVLDALGHAVHGDAGALERAVDVGDEVLGLLAREPGRLIHHEDGPPAGGGVAQEALPIRVRVDQVAGDAVEDVLGDRLVTLLAGVGGHAVALAVDRDLLLVVGVAVQAGRPGGGAVRRMLLGHDDPPYQGRCARPAGVLTAPRPAAITLAPSASAP
jgi:hypothetical protein